MKPRTYFDIVFRVYQSIVRKNWETINETFNRNTMNWVLFHDGVHLSDEQKLLDNIKY